MTRKIIERGKSINYACYIISLLNAAMLVYASFHGDDLANDGLTILALLLGVSPTIAFFALNIWAKSQLKSYAKSRQRFDQMAST